ncbi:hypothetical protein MTO96_013325 [Rhipicephalus appendiculatus]
MVGPYVTWRVPALYKGRVPGSFVHAPAASRLQGPPQFRDISSCSRPDNGGGRLERAPRQKSGRIHLVPQAVHPRAGVDQNARPSLFSPIVRILRATQSILRLTPRQEADDL